MKLDELVKHKLPVGIVIEGPVVVELASVNKLYEDPYIALHEAVYHTRDGKSFQSRSILVIPDCVLVIPVMPDGRLVMVRPLRPAAHLWSWEFPQERMDKDDDVSLRGAALRCVREEVGLAGEPHSLVELASNAVLPDRVTQTTYPVVICGEFDFTTRLDKEEIPDGSIGIFTIGEVRDMIRNGTIQCPSITTAFYKYLLHIGMA